MANIFAHVCFILCLLTIAIACPPKYGNCKILPPEVDFNRDISGYPVDYMSSCFLRAVGENYGTSQNFARRPVHLDWGTALNQGYGIPFSLTNRNGPLVPVTFGTDGCDYSDESDAGPYRIFANATIEGSTGTSGNIPPSSGDRHLISLDTDNCILYETWYTLFVNGHNSTAGVEVCSAAKFNLTLKLPSRPLQWTSADAAGLPIFPGLAKYDEAVSASGITHALRVTLFHAQKAYTGDASHFGPYTNATVMPYGARLRLKAATNTSAYTNPAAKALVKAMQKYGLIFADQGSSMFISGTTDPRWATAMDQLSSHKLYHDDFEVVRMGTITRGYTTSAPVCNGVNQNSGSWTPPTVAPCP